MLDFTDKLVNHESFRSVFLDIKQKTDELLYAHNNVDFLIKPAVDVEAIAKENGIDKIIRVPKKDIPEKHATLRNRVIKLSDKDSEEERRFSTGHELEHHIKEEADAEKKENERNLRERMKIFLKDMERTNIPDKESQKQAESVFKEAARSDYDWVIHELKKIPYFAEIAKPIAENASKNFGKQISEDKAYNSIAKLILMGNKIDDKLILKASNDLYNEEIADYFSANLLVPLERFVLWEDRPDKEIADAFQVTVDCIIKRRKEVALELEYLAE
jgi:Zn-dependent peptidase ImmA (M78 family)